jgi:hypothetical protein
VLTVLVAGYKPPPIEEAQIIRNHIEAASERRVKLHGKKGDVDPSPRQKSPVASDNYSPAKWPFDPMSGASSSEELIVRRAKIKKIAPR